MFIELNNDIPHLLKAATRGYQTWSSGQKIAFLEAVRANFKAFPGKGDTSKLLEGVTLGKNVFSCKGIVIDPDQALTQNIEQFVKNLERYVQGLQIELSIKHCIKHAEQIGNKFKELNNNLNKVEELATTNLPQAAEQLKMQSQTIQAMYAAICESAKLFLNNDPKSNKYIVKVFLEEFSKQTGGRFDSSLKPELVETHELEQCLRNALDSRIQASKIILEQYQQRGNLEQQEQGIFAQIKEIYKIYQQEQIAAQEIIKQREQAERALAGKLFADYLLELQRYSGDTDAVQLLSTKKALQDLVVKLSKENIDSLSEEIARECPANPEHIKAHDSLLSFLGDLEYHSKMNVIEAQETAERLKNYLEDATERKDRLLSSDLDSWASGISYLSNDLPHAIKQAILGLKTRATLGSSRFF